MKEKELEQGRKACKFGLDGDGDIWKKIKEIEHDPCEMMTP